MAKLTTAVLKQKIVDWLVSLGHDELNRVKDWHRYHKSRVANYDEEHDFLISELGWCEYIQHNGSPVDSWKEEDHEPVLKAINVGQNWIRNFAWEDGDNSHVVVITNSDDTEIIALLYHQD